MSFLSTIPKFNKHNMQMDSTMSEE